MNPRYRVNRAGAQHLERIAGLISEAFVPLAVSQWLVPHSSDPRRWLRANFALHLAQALDHGHIDIIGDIAAAAVWVHYEDGRPIPAPPDYDSRLTQACGPHAPRFRQLDDAFDRRHPRGHPHHHLAFLAVEPKWQGRSLGTALLEHHHRHLDQHQLGAYLEASSVNSMRLYRRTGYEERSPAIDLPDNGPSLWPMWRDHQRSRDRRGYRR